MAVKKNAKEAHKPVHISNRRAYHEYEIEETFEAGLVLTGTEVKSLRLSKANLTEAFCVVQHGEVWMRNMQISPYDQGNIWNVEAMRPRKLLLHNWQIVKLATSMQVKGLSIVPTKLYFSKGRAKVEIGVGRGRKLYDKRDRIADRDRDREAQRELATRD